MGRGLPSVLLVIAVGAFVVASVNGEGIKPKWPIHRDFGEMVHTGIAHRTQCSSLLLRFRLALDKNAFERAMSTLPQLFTEEESSQGQTSMSDLLSTRVLTLLSAWKKLQVSYYGGKYSIHRLLALEAYTRTTSLSRALIVCVWTPIPMTALVFLLESLPLCDPKDGWQANYGFWIRVAVVTGVIAHTSTGQAVYFIDTFSISGRQLASLSVGIAIIFTACAIMISAFTIFPIPFLILVLTPIYNIIHIILFRLILGAQLLRQLFAQSKQLIKYMNFLHAQIMMMFVYPAYEVLFRFVEGSKFQLAVILLLPLMKVVIKNIVLRCTMHVEDMTPELVIFTVDFFNAIYVATCMQSATSAIAISAIILTDISQTIVMLYGLHHRTKTILTRVRGSVPKNENLKSLLAAACSMCRSPQMLEKQFRSGINTFSHFPHRLPTEDHIFLSKLTATDQAVKSSAHMSPPTISDIPSRESATTSFKWFHTCTRKKRNEVHPDTPELSRADDTRVPEILPPHDSDHPTLLRYLLETLFTIECLVVTSYLEAVIPFFYTTYILVMVHLPSARYHSEMAGVTHDNVVSTILPVFVFGLLQFVSFMLLVIVIKRNCGMKALCHLAFVLETHMWSIMSKLMVWMLITLCFRVVHFGTFYRSVAELGSSADGSFAAIGVDFTFKFAKLGQ